MQVANADARAASDAQCLQRTCCSPSSTAGLEHTSGSEKDTRCRVLVAIDTLCGFGVCARLLAELLPNSAASSLSRSLFLSISFCRCAIARRVSHSACVPPKPDSRDVKSPASLSRGEHAPVEMRRSTAGDALLKGRD